MMMMMINEVNTMTTDLRSRGQKAMQDWYCKSAFDW